MISGKVLMRSLLRKDYVKVILKIFFYYAFIKLIVLFLTWVFTLPIMGIPSLENMASSDLSLNDLYYQINKLEHSYPQLSGKTVLINSGSLNSENFRAELADLLLIISEFNPAVIAVDHDFDPDQSLQGTELLKNSVSFIPNLILAKSYHDESAKLDFENPYLEFANVDFPAGQHTIRRYYSGNNSLAEKVAAKFEVIINPEDFYSDDFILKYYSESYHPYDCEIDNPSPWEEYSSPPSFPMIEASDILLGQLPVCSEQFLENKAVLIGHIGNQCLLYENDVEDKWPVPTDKEMVNRQKSMSGILIHANAIENFLDFDNRFLGLSDTILFEYFISELFIIAYLCFLVFVRAGKLANVILLLGLSVPTIFIVIYLMRFNFYIEIGATLIQFLLFEELVEIIEPFYLRLKKNLLN